MHTKHELEEDIYLFPDGKDCQTNSKRLSHVDCGCHCGILLLNGKRIM